MQGHKAWLTQVVVVFITKKNFRPTIRNTETQAVPRRKD